LFTVRFLTMKKLFFLLLALPIFFCPLAAQDEPEVVQDTEDVEVLDETSEEVEYVAPPATPPPPVQPVADSAGGR
jgi:hypothetical protein